MKYLYLIEKDSWSVFYYKLKVVVFLKVVELCCQIDGT